MQGLFNNVIADYLWAKGVLLTSPAVATVGTSLTVPLAILSDLVLPRAWLIDARAPTAISALAALAVVAGFVAINLAGGDGAPPREEGEAGRALPRPAEPEEHEGAKGYCSSCLRSVHAPLLEASAPRSEPSFADAPSFVGEPGGVGRAEGSADAAEASGARASS